MSDKQQAAIKDLLTKIIKDIIQESVEPPIRTLIKSIQMIRDRLNELESSVESVITDQGGKIDKLREEMNVLSETAQKLEEMLQEMPNAPKTNARFEKKTVAKLNSVEKPPAEIIDTSKLSSETISTMESKEKATKRKITEEKIKALFNKLEQGLPSPEKKVEAASTTENVSKTADKEISPPKMEKISEPTYEGNIASANSLSTSKEEAEKASPDLFAEFQGVEFESEEETTKIPLAGSGGPSPAEIPISESRTALDDLTVELSELEIQRTDFERKLGDIAFDRMRGLITEEEYKTKIQELRKNLENISKRIEQIMDRMKY
jgi:chromosome segregation ATPase